jgi:hypothetical protein
MMMVLLAGLRAMPIQERMQTKMLEIGSGRGYWARSVVACTFGYGAAAHHKIEILPIQKTFL